MKGLIYIVFFFLSLTLGGRRNSGQRMVAWNLKSLEMMAKNEWASVRIEREYQLCSMREGERVIRYFLLNLEGFS